jgi:PKD repeat protein
MKKITFIIALLFLSAIYFTGNTQELPNNWLGDTGIDTYQESTIVHGGTYSCRIDVNTGSQSSCDFSNTEAISVTEGDTYTFSFWAYTSEFVRITGVLDWVGASSTYSGAYVGPNTLGWAQFTYSGTVPTGATGVNLRIRCYDVSGFVAPETQYVDDFTFESPTGTPLTVTNGDMESWPSGITAIEKAYSISGTEMDVVYDYDVSSVDPADYTLTGTATITFTGATIDGTDAKIVHLTGASSNMNGDATLDNIADAALGLNSDFYAGIMPISFTNTNNPGGTILNGYIATYQGIISANDAYNNVWISDAAGAYNGVMIYDGSFDGLVAVGDEILMIAERAVYNYLTELVNPEKLSTISTGGTPYGPDVIDGSDIDESLAADTNPGESWEGQLVQINTFTVDSYTNYDYRCSWSDGLTTYYFHIGDNVDYHLNNITLNVGQTYQSVTGVVDWYNSNSNYRINPREQNDIVALPGLDANFSADQTSVFVGTTVNFTDLTTGGTAPYSYSWDLDGDGFEDETVQNPSFTYNVAGVYTVELTVTDDILDTDTETKVDYITVSENPYASLVINEVDADQVGTDDQEFIELYDGGAGNTDLSGLVVVLYNGSDDASYLPAVDLDGYSTNSDGYLVMGSALVPNVDIVIGITNILQNGADAVALHVGNAEDFPNDTPVTDVNLLDALVYDTNDGDDAGLLDVLTPGQPQINEGGRGDKDAHSNQRIPNGSGGQRNTDTYDQSPPTPGTENVLIFTDWTGDVDEDWDNAGNWHNGLPDASLNATIPDVSEKAPFPVIYGTATTGALYIANSAQLTVAPGGDLTTTGLFTNNGTFVIESNGIVNPGLGESGSFIDMVGVFGGGVFEFQRDIRNVTPFGAQNGWHLISSPLPSGEFTSDDLYYYYLNWFDNTTQLYVHHAGTIPCTPAPLLQNNLMEGWSIKYDNQYGAICAGGVEDEVINMIGTSFNTGVQSAGFGAGWDLLGNPYPNAIDPDLIGWAAGLNTNTVYMWDGGAGGWVLGAFGLGNNIPPAQGFFVEGATAGTFAFTGGERIHDPFQWWWKGSSDLLRLRATVQGADNYDDAYIRFNNVSTTGLDKEWDANKMFAGIPETPQIYTTTGGLELALNTQPAVEMVPMAFTCETSGTYTIEAIETGSFTNVVLEDLLTGIQTDLLAGSYTFEHVAGADPDRFFVHFTPLGTPELSANSIDIWSNDHKIYVQAPEINGDIVVFNMMGQEVIRAEIEPGLNILPVSDVNTYYVVRVVSNNVTRTGKVYVK